MTAAHDIDDRGIRRRAGYAGWIPALISPRDPWGTLPLSSVLDTTAPPNRRVETTVFGILTAISFCHLLNDMMQSLLPAIYPILKDSLHLDFGQIGLVTLTNQVTASLLQPAIGLYTDRHPKPYSLAIGMTFTLTGLLLLSVAHHFLVVLLAAAMVGLGSAVFHPESSRIARLASGGRHGFAQSLFQVGGNAGSSLGPLLAAFVVLPRGQSSISWFSLAAMIAIALLWNVGSWYKQTQSVTVQKKAARALHPSVSSRQAGIVLMILLALIFSKYVYLTSLSSYYTFYLIEKFGVSVQSAQVHLFIFLGAVAAGTILGGPIGDRIGRRFVILWSILGVLPFTLALPYANLLWTEILSVIIGVILASAFSAIVVYAQELVPGRVGMIAGLFFGLAFGIGGLGAAVLGQLADHKGIVFVYSVCAFLPLIGILAVFLPNLDHLSGPSGPPEHVVPSEPPPTTG
jgi:MFS transporter, FSR family, fosmidomycin resistance protein